MKVSEYFLEWLAGKKPEIELSTYEAYEIYVKKHINPYFDKLGKEIKELKPIDIKKYVTEKLTNGRCDKTGKLSNVTVRKHLNIIKQAFKEAVLYEIMDKNPAEPVKLPKTTSVSDKAEFISLPRVKSILEALKGHPLFELVFVTVYYGLRRSEVLGLKWSAIDFENNELHICHTIVKNRSIVAKDKTKTQSSKRTFELLPEIKEVLLDLKARQTVSSPYVFTWEDGRVFRPDYVTRGFQRALKAHGLSVIRFHDLRHATATILFDMGWSIADVQHWLGHSDIETTMNIYVAYSKNRKIAVGSSLQGAFI